ncbi:MAG: helix-turn-helix transcriptional regulator [Candidatus Baltobacteraceae bacterium]
MKKRDSAGSGPTRTVPTLLADFVSESDPAYPIITEILRVVPASRWAFARLMPDGELAGLLLGSREIGGELSRLKNEFERQREKAKIGPRIAAMLGPLGDFESGVTLLFADADASFGILTLLRTSELGPFTSSEISVLALSLDAASERLSGLRLHSTESVKHAPRAAQESGESFYVLDGDLQIVLAWTADEQRRVALTGLRTRIADRLPAVLEAAVKDLIAGWRTHSDTQESGVAHPVPFLVVRTQPMSGPAGLFIGVRIERFPPASSLAGPAARFHISPRELQVLALLLDGATLQEVGRTLHISSSTVQDHIKSMVDKTASRNRTELIARVLGWQHTSEACQP